MPSIKRTGVKAAERKTGFEAYEGPVPTRRGMYRAVIKSGKVTTAKETKRTGLAFVAELQAAPGDPKDHKQFDGMPVFPRLWLGDEEALKIREENLYAAIGAGDDPNIVYDENDDNRIKKIGKKAIKDIVVNVDLGFSRSAGYEGQIEIDGIYKFKDAVKFEANDDEDEDLMEDSEEDEDEAEVEAEENDEDFEERSAELAKIKLAELKRIASEDYEIDIKGLKKDDLIEAILEHEFPTEEEPDEDEDEAEEAEDESEEEDEDEDEEEEEEDDEEEEDESAERRAELEGLDRAALKTILKSAAPDFKVLKRHDDSELVDAILALEFPTDTPF